MYKNGSGSFVFKRGMLTKPVSIFFKYDNIMPNISAADIHCVIIWIPFKELDNAFREQPHTKIFILALYLNHN